MRILYLAYGGNIQDYSFLVKLSEKRYQVFYVHLSPVDKEFNVQDVKSFCLRYNPNASLPIKIVEMFLAYFRFKKLVRATKPEILHAGFGLIAAASGYHPFLYMPWASDILLVPQQSLLHRKLIRYVIRRADMINCDAESIKKRIMEIADYPRENIAVFPWGVDLNTFYPSKDIRGITRRELGWANKQILIMTRKFKSIYGIEYFLQALPTVIKEVPNVRVLLIGNGPLESKFRNMIREMKIQNEVRFLGKIPNKELSRYLNAADLYISSSLSDGSSLSLLEAMACALPVIVTDVPAILEWVADGVNGLVVARKNSALLSKSIVSLLANRDLLREMGEKNLMIARERADWNRNFKKLEMIYEELTKSRSYKY